MLYTQVLPDLAYQRELLHQATPLPHSFLLMLTSPVPGKELVHLCHPIMGRYRASSFQPVTLAEERQWGRKSGLAGMAQVPEAFALAQGALFSVRLRHSALR